MLTKDKASNLAIPPQGLLDHLTRVDELLVAQLQLLKSLGVAAPAAGVDLVEQRRRAESGQWVPYSIKSFAMDTARTNELVATEGDYLVAKTDGTLAGVGARFNHPANDLLPLEDFNPFYGFRWWKLYLTHTAQAGKTLKLMVGREASAYAESQSITVQTVVPNAKAAVFGPALPVAEAAWLPADISPTNSPSHIRIYVCVSVAGVFRVARTIGAVTLVEDLNSGVALAAGAGYMFEVPWRTGDSINFRYSVTTGTINRLLVDELT